MLRVNWSEFRRQGVGDTVCDRHFHPIVNERCKWKVRCVSLRTFGQFPRWWGGDRDHSPARGANVTVRRSKIGEVIAAVRTPGATIEVNHYWPTVTEILEAYL